MSFEISLGNYLGSGTKTGISVSITLSGLTPFTGYADAALVGDHVGISATTSEDTITAYAWGSTPGGSEYGTGSNPTAFSAVDTGDPGKPATLYLRATVSGEEYDRSVAIRAAVPVNDVAPVVSSGTGLGDVLSVTTGAWAGGTGSAFTYRWQRGGADIAGATASNYMLAQVDDMASIRCVVTYTTSGGAVSANSNTVIVDDFAAPNINGLPTISGTEQVGSTLTAVSASATGNPTPSLSWQWARNGSAIGGATSSTYALVNADEGATLTVVQTQTNALATDTAESAGTGTISAALSPPEITNLVADPQNGQQFPISFDMIAGGGQVDFVLTTSATSPSPAQVAAGQDHTGAVAYSGTFSAPATGSYSIPLVDGLDGFFYLHLSAHDRAGNRSTDVDIVGPIALDSTAPILSAVSASLSGTTATLSWSTNEGNGNSYWVCTTSATQPSEAQIIAVQDHTGAAAFASGIQAISNPGTQADQAIPGLSAGQTYFFHLLQRDASGNTSTRVSSAGVTVASVGVSAEVNIFKRSNVEVAPEALTFDLTLTGFDTLGPGTGEIYNPQLHEIYYLWDFDDDYMFTAPLNLITEHNKAGIGYGPVVSHTFRSAGTYNVSCLVIEPSSGKTATAILPVTVGNPETQFAGADTIFVSPTSDWANAPAGATWMTNLNSAWNALKESENPTRRPTRIMLNRGETHTLPTLGYTGNGFDQISSVHICAGTGDGARPILSTTASDAFNFNDWSDNSSGIDVVIHGIDFNGPWDSQTETGNSPILFYSLSGPPGYFAMDDCTITGFGGLYSSNHFDLPTYDYANFHINDTVLTDRRVYGIFFEDGALLSIVGSRVDTHINANAGGSGANFNESGPVRTGGSDALVVTNSSMFSRTGWTAVGTTQVYQPVMRVNGSGTGTPTVNVQCNSLEGANIYTSTMDNGGIQATATNQIIDKNYFLGGVQTWDFIATHNGGFTVRNNIFVNPAVDRNLIDTNDFQGFVLFLDHGNHSTECFSAPNKIYNNTMVNLQSDAQYPSGSAGLEPEVRYAAEFTDVVAENNVYHQPNSTVPYIADAPLVTIPALFTPLEIGYKDGSTSLVAGTATPAGSAASYEPDTGSAALGDALAGNTAYDDYFGVQRAQYPSRGATEMR